MIRVGVKGLWFYMITLKYSAQTWFVCLSVQSEMSEVNDERTKFCKLCCYTLKSKIKKSFFTKQYFFLNSNPDDISSCFIFHFFKILIYCVVRVVKWQKMVNEKKLCLSCSIAQEPYIIWFSFMVHMCKMIISPGSFFIFSKIRFFRWLRESKCKK